MESAPTFFAAGGASAQRAMPRVEFSPFVENEIRRGAFYMRPRRFILPQAGTGGYGIRPYVFCGGRRPPPQRAVPRVELSPFVESEIRRGAFYMRPRRFILPQAGTGGYGIRPYVFVAGGAPAQRGPRGAFLPVVRASGFILLYFIIRNLQKNDRLSSNKSRRSCRYFSGFVPKKCQDTSSWIFGCRSACVPQQNPAH